MTQDQSPKTKDPRTKTNQVSAIILAAGRSSRMGAFKPLLPFGRKTVIQTCIDNLRSGGVQSIVVVFSEERRSAELSAHLKDFEVTLANNPDPDSEMSASVACGVLAVPETTKAVIIIPVDHAAVPGEVVSSLIHEWKQGALLVKPVVAGRGGHPVLVDLEFRNGLLNLNHALGLKGFLREHQTQVRRIEVNSNYIARDMDTWDDYRALHLELFGVQPPEQRPDRDRRV